jgi:nicotinamide phosphoribosyltransferase
MNFLLRTDSYKPTHWRQYPPGTQYVYSYLESRGGEYDETVFFGLQYYLKKYLEGCVFTGADIGHAERFCEQHFGQKGLFNTKGWEYILKTHGGRLPLAIKSVPEGAVVPTGNVLMTICNTDPMVPWLTNYVESLLLKLWYPITVATRSREVKKIIKHYLQLTGNPTTIGFKLHDFGYRGVSSEESAAIGGASHLVNFLGSDTIAGILLLQDYYQTNGNFPGFSIPASEHSTITSWGKQHEREAFANMLEQYPTGMVACVSDSYDIANACGQLWGTELRGQVLNRDGVLVVRPDSGDPCPTVLQVLNILGERFGTVENSMGYRLLNPKIRVIQGDGVNPSSIRRILDTMKWQKWSADNIAFGMGGALLQQLDRDTLKFAFKCSAICINGIWQDVFKEAPGKQSKKGRLALTEVDNKLTTVRKEDAPWDLLHTSFHNGEVLQSPMLSDIRDLADVPANRQFGWQPAIK